MDTSHEKYQQRIEALVEIGKRLTADIRLSEKEIFELIYEQASKKLGMENLSIALYNETTDTIEFVLAVVQGRRVDFKTEQGWENRTHGQGKTETIIHSKEPLWLKTQEEVKKTEFSPIPGHKNFEGRTPNSWVGVPMITGSRVLGVIANYGYGEDYLYDDEDIKIMQAFADRVSIAIANARLLQAVYEISKTANMVRNLEEFYESIHKIISSLMYAKNFRIVKFDDTGKISGHFHFKDEKDQDSDFQSKIIEEGLTKHVFDTGNPLLISNAQDREKLKVKAIGTTSKSWLGIPLKTQNKIIGVMTVHHYDKENVYGESEEDILMFVSEQIAMAIDRVRAQEELEEHRNQLEEIVHQRTEELNKKNEELEKHRNQLEKLVSQLKKQHSQQNALIELAQKLTSSIQLKEEDIFKQIHDYANQIMDTDNMYIALYDETNDFVHFPLAFKNGQTTEIPARKAGGGRTEVIINTKRYIFIQTRKESEDWYKQPGRSEYMGDPLSSWIGVPMMTGETVLGVVATYHPTKDYVYTEDDLKILQAMANIAAIALHNSRLYSEKEQQAQELEEKNISLTLAFGKIAETESVLTRSTIAADIVHRLNNLAGTIPIWANTIKTKTELLINEIQNNISLMRTESEQAINNEAITREDTDFVYRLQNIIATIPIRVNQLHAVINDKTNKIQEDVNNLRLEVERLNKPRQKVETEIAPIIETIIDQLSIQYDEKIKSGELSIDKQIAPDLNKILAFPMTIPNAIFNIISNGAESVLSNDKGSLSVIAENARDKDSNWVKIVIKDTGAGISEQARDKLFTPFFSTKGEGRGYGLWRAKNVIENIGGRIDFKSEQNRETTFTIMLPALQEDSNE